MQPVQYYFMLSRWIAELTDATATTQWSTTLTRKRHESCGDQLSENVNFPTSELHEQFNSDGQYNFFIKVSRNTYTNAAAKKYPLLTSCTPDC